MRYIKNPLRILDCKNENCQKIFELPEIKEVIMADYICDECSSHFDQLTNYLDNLNIKYQNISVCYTQDTYPAKSFDGKFMASGTYPTLLILIDDGLGSNWWSVLYPEFFNVSYEASSEIEYRSYIIDKYKELR